LQNLQERVAAGDRAAFVEQPRLMNSLTQAFNAAAPEVWGKVENARALIIYLLSGGSPALGHKILATHRLAPSEEPLAKGALAYLEDRAGAEQEELLAFDPRALDLNLGGHVAFVQSILLTLADRARAIARLDEARLLMPGSLVEEAALRREVALLAETENFDKFAALARQYWTRFRASPYADNFLRQFTLAAARVSLSIKADQWNRLDELLENLQPDARRAIYLNMAHAALVSGNVALAAASAQRGLPLFAEGSLDRQRAQLYIAAAQVATPDFARADAALSRIDRSKLATGDGLLAQATDMVAAQMRLPPQQVFAAEPPGEPSGVDATITRAQTGLQAADEAMESLRKTMERKMP
jgi:chemotaxis protein MotC